MAKLNLRALVKLRDFVKNVPNNIDNRATKAIADNVREKMLEFIGKGISPILGNGRFPAYKASTTREKKGYPYNVQKKYPDKKQRPVNLFLSGKFLRSLVSRPLKGRKLVIEIGFSDKLSKLKEDGHRKGANGQPRRPIIPSDSEDFSATIKLTIIKMMKDAVRAAIKRGA